jgi:hypothetical protein
VFLNLEKELFHYRLIVGEHRVDFDLDRLMLDSPTHFLDVVWKGGGEQQCLSLFRVMPL